MSFIITKVILGTIFFLSGLGATLTMLILMGRAEKKTSPTTLKKLHKLFGLVFFLLFLVLVFMGLRYWASVGDGISTRAVMHAILALSLFIVFITKVTIVQFFKQFLKMAPTLGLIVFCLSFVVFATSGIFYIVRGYYSNPVSDIVQTHSLGLIQSRAEAGKMIYDTKCLSCHSADTDERKIGPSLRSLFKNDTLPHTGNPSTVENIKKQLERPALTMPSFKDFTDQELADLFAYLQTL
jgi:hypothetical protein